MDKAATMLWGRTCTTRLDGTLRLDNLNIDQLQPAQMSSADLSALRSYEASG